ncbi:MAG: DUF1549 domain-containing protein, partial [Verrucomicrobiales bacterium]|nr:DUF1549 domain-containing protein [Verrucomicrobiales bacterium]
MNSPLPRRAPTRLLAREALVARRSWGRLRAVGLALLGMTGFTVAGATADSLWAYRPLRNPHPPSVRDAAWSERPIDRFLLAGMEAAGLSPAPDADRETLCRRVTFDLTGLPPTPEAIDAFLADARPDAFERLVDGLLASPRFGEHWARHWFDVVRFGESVTLRGLVFKEAWRYRDYVIRAFDDDRPVDRFLREQIAGDLLPADTLDERRDGLVATTFLMLGNTNLEEQDKKQLEMDVIDEQLDVIGKALLGQTVSCARCHDHKFDPIPIRDYYALAGILKNALALRHDNVSAWAERPLPLPPEEEARHARRDAAVTALVAEIKATPKGDTNALESLETRLREARASLAPRPMVMAPRESAVSTNVPVHRRGSVHSLGEEVPRGVIEAVTSPRQPRPGPSESGRRELADWVVSPDNPLARRVFVNRIWLWVMGRGLVRTPDNFGTTGEPPTHPELLDALASAFGGTAEGGSHFP